MSQNQNPDGTDDETGDPSNEVYVLGVSGSGTGDPDRTMQQINERLQRAVAKAFQPVLDSVATTPAAPLASPPDLGDTLDPIEVTPLSEIIAEGTSHLEGRLERLAQDTEAQLEVLRKDQEAAARSERFSRWTAVVSIAVAIVSLGASVFR